MSEIEHIESHWDSTVSESVLEQYRGSEKWLAVLKSVVDRFQVAEDDAFELLSVFRYDTSDRPTGYRLDWLAGLVNVTRREGETDAALASRMEDTVFHRDSGTPDRVIANVKLLSGDDTPVFFDESPATFLVYTPNGHQLARSAVRKLAPAGVLGVPAARIVLANGKTLVNGEGVEYGIVDADGNEIVGADGDTMAGPMRGARTLLCVASDNNLWEGKRTLLTEDGLTLTTEDGTILTEDA